MAATTTTSNPLYHVLGVYENQKNQEDIRWLEDLIKSGKLNDPSVGSIPAHAIDFELSLLEKPNLVEALLCDQPSTSGVKTATSSFVDYVREKTESKHGEELPPVIFVALGFAALVAMKAVVSELNFTPMGMIVASVSEETATGKSAKFQNWHKKLAKEEALSKQRRVNLEHHLSKNRRLIFKQELPKNRRVTLVEELAKKDYLTKNEREAIEKWLTDREDPALSALKKVLREFNDHCRHERIRLSYVFRNQEASHDRRCRVVLCAYYSFAAA
jgi:hypothetical protein